VIGVDFIGERRKMRIQMGRTCALTEFRDHHGCAWVALGRLDDEGVSGYDCDGDCPEGNHAEIRE
jgi:hypothetical protein